MYWLRVSIVPGKLIMVLKILKLKYLHAILWRYSYVTPYCKLGRRVESDEAVCH